MADEPLHGTLIPGDGAFDLGLLRHGDTIAVTAVGAGGVEGVRVQLALDRADAARRRLGELIANEPSGGLHVAGQCRICGLEEERHGLCAGHREEWIQWASCRPDDQNDEGFDRWIESRVRQRDGEGWTPRELAVLNALVTYAAENIPGGLREDERAIALKVGRGALQGSW